MQPLLRNPPALQPRLSLVEPVTAKGNEAHQNNNYETFAKGYVERLPEAASSGAYARTEAYREHLYKLRRQQMGLPERPPR